MSVLRLCASTAIFTALLFTSIEVRAQTLFSGIKQDNNKPIDIQADDLVVQPNHKVATFKGNVVASQDSLNLHSNTMKVFYKENKKANENGVSRIETDGNVKLLIEDRQATSEKGLYDVDKGVMELTGNVVLKRGPNELYGERFIYETATGKSQLVGGAKAAAGDASAPTAAGKGRVRARLIPQAPAEKKAE